MADALMPDPARVMGEHLRTTPLVVARVGARSAEKLSTTLPAIRYAVTSNPKVSPEEWAPTLQVECWAESSAEAWRIARAVDASLSALLGIRSTADVVSAEATTAFPSPDPDTGRPRVFVLVALILYALDPMESL